MPSRPVNGYISRVAPCRSSQLFTFCCGSLLWLFLLSTDFPSAFLRPCRWCKVVAIFLPSQDVPDVQFPSSFLYIYTHLVLWSLQYKKAICPRPLCVDPGWLGIAVVIGGYLTIDLIGVMRCLLCEDSSNNVSCWLVFYCPQYVCYYYLIGQWSHRHVRARAHTQHP